MSTLTDWINAACTELGIDPGAVAQRRILDLARDVAHQLDRTAAPLTAFLLGLAVGAGQDLDGAAERLAALAAGWGAGDGGIQ